jgi:hypothetical protein
MENTSEPKSNKHPGGRPSKYSKELAEEICLKVSISSVGLTKICADNPRFPCPETIYEWKIKIPEFSHMYAQAKMNQADLLAEEILDISDFGANDTYIDDNGNEKFNGEVVARSRLRVDSRKWLASKLLPKAYGDKVFSETNVTFNHEQALQELKLKKND